MGGYTHITTCPYSFTGTPPWMAENEILLAERVVKDELTFPDKVGGGGDDGDGVGGGAAVGSDESHASWALDPHLQNLLTRMLCKNPAKRLSLQQVRSKMMISDEPNRYLFFELMRFISSHCKTGHET